MDIGTYVAGSVVSPTDESQPHHHAPGPPGTDALYLDASEQVMCVRLHRLYCILIVFDKVTVGIRY
jgi:hypothetical protein